MIEIKAAGTYEDVRTCPHHILAPFIIREGGGGLSEYPPSKLVPTKIFEIPAALENVENYRSESGIRPKWNNMFSTI